MNRVHENRALSGREVGALQTEIRSDLSALREIRDISLMLSLGNTYLCEEPFLKKIGHAMDAVLENLHGEILAGNSKGTPPLVCRIRVGNHS